MQSLNGYNPPPTDSRLESSRPFCIKTVLKEHSFLLAEKDLF